MRGISSTNLVNKEVSVQAELKIDLSKLWHYLGGWLTLPPPYCESDLLDRSPGVGEFAWAKKFVGQVEVRGAGESKSTTTVTVKKLWNSSKFVFQIHKKCRKNFLVLMINSCWNFSIFAKIRLSSKRFDCKKSLKFVKIWLSDSWNSAFRAFLL